MKPTYQTVGGNRHLHTALVARASRFARGALLFGGVALAHRVRAEEPVAVEVIEPEPVATPAEPLAVAPDLTETGPAELIELARLRISTGDEEGARIVLRQAMERPGADIDVATYLLGLAWEYEGDAAQALVLYDEGLERWPTSDLTPDRLYRRAEALAALDRPAEALEALDALEAFPLPEDDARKVDLSRATWTLATGRTGPGLRLLREALAVLPADAHPWQQARARAYLARWLADEAAALDLDTSERKLVGRLEDRLALVQRIEKEATAIAQLDQPEWVLDGLLTLGGAYEGLGDALVTHRRPKRLSPEQLEIYEPAVATKVDAAFVKALTAYDYGLEMAVRIGYTGPRVDRLAAAREALAARSAR